MQYSGKLPRPIGKNKSPNNQISPPYNGGLRFLSPPNVTNSGQLQFSRKFVNNIGNINEVSVLQYHRSTNMQFKNNNLEMNNYQSFRHQQQGFFYKTPQYQNHMSPSSVPKPPPNQHPHRRVYKDQPKPPLPALPVPLQTNLETSVRKSREMPRNAQDVRKANSKTRFNKLTTNVNAESNERSSNEDKSKEEAKEVIEDDKNKGQVVDINIEQVNENGETTGKDGSDGTCSKTKLTREKTPMCLINDLARFNKISFQYRLTSESGPAHCKRFTVTLMLGDEEYTAEGTKIKEAQHLAAKEAIEKTKYKHPVAKVNRRLEDESAKPHLTPTVELNALAMKLGQQTYYILDDQNLESTANDSSINQQEDTSETLITQQQQITDALANGRQIPTILQRRQQFQRFQNRFPPFQRLPSAYTYYSPLCPTKITLIVGTKQFVGVGKTLQLAKHDAASKALKLLKEQAAREQQEMENETQEDNECKSPISLVFEIGIKRNLTVDFKVLREEGPAHMRTFITACIVGDIVTEGEGTGKKTSKKKAAQKMLEELRKLPPLSPVSTPPKRTKPKVTTKKSNSREVATDERKDYAEKAANHRSKKYTTTAEGKKPSRVAESDNPINKLIEWHQNRKEKEPEFKIINEFGKENSRRKQFVVEVSSNNIVVRGFGINKRLAKQDAARKFLDTIRNTSEQTVAVSETENEPLQSHISNKENPDTSNSIPDSNAGVKTDLNQNTIIKETENKQLPITKDTIEKTTNATKIQNLSEKETSKTSLIKSNETSLDQQTNGIVATTCISSTSATATETLSNTSAKSQTLHMKDQLMYLAKLLGFEVEFSDYPKGNHDEFLTIVMLSTTPPQICHGVGVSSNESQEDAAKNALKILSKMGLNNVVKS